MSNDVMFCGLAEQGALLATAVPFLLASVVGWTDKTGTECLRSEKGVKFHAGRQLSAPEYLTQPTKGECYEWTREESDAAHQAVDDVNCPVCVWLPLEVVLSYYMISLQNIHSLELLLEWLY